VLRGAATIAFAEETAILAGIPREQLAIDHRAICEPAALGKHDVPRKSNAGTSRMGDARVSDCAER
jgi:hypothetical protein